MPSDPAPLSDSESLGLAVSLLVDPSLCVYSPRGLCQSWIS